MVTGKFAALMTSGISFFCGAIPDLTLFAVHKQIIRQASTASNILGRQVLAVGESTFVGNVSFVKTDQPFLEFFIMITMCQVNGTDAAIKATW